MERLEKDSETLNNQEDPPAGATVTAPVKETENPGQTASEETGKPSFSDETEKSKDRGQETE